jgi:hypothetical protein
VHANVERERLSGVQLRGLCLCVCLCVRACQCGMCLCCTWRRVDGGSIEKGTDCAGLFFLKPVWVHFPQLLTVMGALGENSLQTFCKLSHQHAPRVIRRDQVWCVRSGVWCYHMRMRVPRIWCALPQIAVHCSNLVNV